MNTVVNSNSFKAVVQEGIVFFIIQFASMFFEQLVELVERSKSEVFGG